MNEHGGKSIYEKARVREGKQLFQHLFLVTPFPDLVFVSVNSLVFKFRKGLFWNKSLSRLFPGDLCVI